MCTFYFVQCIWGIWGLFFISCYGQDILFRHDSDEDTMESNNFEPGQIPESLLIRIKDVNNVTEFMSRFISNNWYPQIGNNLTSNITGRIPLSGVPRTPPSLALPAICKPDEQIVELERPANGAVMLWPSCVRIRRCAGCCTSKRLTCNPTATSPLVVTVLQVRYNPQTPNSFEDQGTRTFTLEQHDRCACGCKEQPTDCNPSVHEYRENECRCVCRNQDEAQSCSGPKKIWDSRDCLCKCRRTQLCSTGRFYNIQTCKCETWRSSLNAYELHHYNISSNSTTQLSP